MALVSVLDYLDLFIQTKFAANRCSLMLANSEQCVEILTEKRFDQDVNIPGSKPFEVVKKLRPKEAKKKSPPAPSTSAVEVKKALPPEPVHSRESLNT